MGSPSQRGHRHGNGYERADAVQAVLVRGYTHTSPFPAENSPRSQKSGVDVVPQGDDA